MGAVTSERPCISNQFSDVFLEPLCHRTCDSFQFNFTSGVWSLDEGLSSSLRLRVEGGQRQCQFSFTSLLPVPCLGSGTFFRHSVILEISEVIRTILPTSKDK